MIFLDHPFLKLGANVKHFYVLWAWNKHYDKLDYRFLLASFPLVFLLRHFGMLCNTSKLMEIVFLWDCHHCAGSSRLLLWCVTSSGFCWKFYMLCLNCIVGSSTWVYDQTHHNSMWFLWRQPMGTRFWKTTQQETMAVLHFFFSCVQEEQEENNHGISLRLSVGICGSLVHISDIVVSYWHLQEGSHHRFRIFFWYSQSVLSRIFISRTFQVGGTFCDPLISWGAKQSKTSSSIELISNSGMQAWCLVLLEVFQAFLLVPSLFFSFRFFFTAAIPFLKLCKFLVSLLLLGYLTLRFLHRNMSLDLGFPEHNSFCCTITGHFSCWFFHFFFVPSMIVSQQSCFPSCPSSWYECDGHFHSLRLCCQR